MQENFLNKKLMVTPAANPGPERLGNSGVGGVSGERIDGLPHPDSIAWNQTTISYLSCN